MQVSESREHPNRFARQLFDGLPARYDVLAEVLSFGQNGRWRRALVDAVALARPGVVATGTAGVAGPPLGADVATRPAGVPAGGPLLVADVATGPAGVARQIAARTDAVIAGVDLTEAMLRRAQVNVRRHGQASRIHLVAGRGEQLPFPDGTFDALSFTYLLRYVADPAATIRELVRVVKPGGVVANLEFHVPPNRWWRWLWAGYTRAVLPVAGWATGGREWFRVGRFLGPSISAHYRAYPTEWHEEAWRSAGVEDVHIRLMSLGGGLVMWGRKGVAVHHGRVG